MYQLLRTAKYVLDQECASLCRSLCVCVRHVCGNYVSEMLICIGGFMVLMKGHVS